MSEGASLEPGQLLVGRRLLDGRDCSNPELSEEKQADYDGRGPRALSGIATEVEGAELVDRGQCQKKRHRADVAHQFLLALLKHEDWRDRSECRDHQEDSADQRQCGFIAVSGVPEAFELLNFLLQCGCDRVTPLVVSPEEIITRFTAGELTREQVVDELVRWPYAKSSELDGPLDDIMVTAPGSFDVVVQAMYRGALPIDVYDEILRRSQTPLDAAN